jgi:hypothetical protein
MSKNINVKARIADDHDTFIRINSKAAETPARNLKISEHKGYIRLKKVRPDLFPQEQPQDETKQNGNQTKTQCSRKCFDSRYYPATHCATRKNRFQTM